MRFPMQNFTPFVHGLVNADYVGGPYYEPNNWGPGMTAGGGLDYETPWFNHHLAIRLFQADYEYMHVDFGDMVYGGTASINAAQLSAGIVIHAGSLAPPPPITRRARRPGIDLSRRSGHGDGNGGWSEPEGPRGL